MKDYNQWMKRKAAVHNKDNQPPTFNEGEIWWCAVGDNVGVEVDGKGAAFSRPVIVYRKLSRNGLLAVPLTSVIKTGTWYVSFKFNGRDECANLSQIKVVSVKRLYNKMGDMSRADFSAVKIAFKKLYCRK
jgi:mRNA interferase MazF